MNMTLSKNPIDNNIDNLSSLSTKLILDEFIWGHRLYNEQTATMTLLEFLNLATFAFKQDELLVINAESIKNEHEVSDNALYGFFPYSAKLLWRVRELVFNNPYLDYYAKQDLNNDALWAEWEKKFKENSLFCKKADLSYLKNTFDYFSRFYETISLLRANAFETLSQKRWTSKYLFPYGINSLYEDVELKSKVGINSGEGSSEYSVSVDRRFFARTGEILYLMLAFSKVNKRIAELLTEKFFKEKSALDNLIVLLEDAPNDCPCGVKDSVDINAGALPLIHHKIFDSLGEDWVNILENNIPTNDALYYLSQISYLHLIRYFLIRSKEVLGDDVNTDIICEILSPQRNKIRTLSASRYVQNSELSLKAINKYIDNIKQTKTWQELSNEDSLEELHEFIKKFFLLNNEIYDEIKAKPDKESVLDFIRKTAIVRHKEHVYNVHREYGKQIGLVSSVGTNRFRYILSDQLIKTLVVANVKDRMTTTDFYRQIYERYEIIVSQDEGKRYVESNNCDNKDFENNVKALENRLNSLGLLIRLSDSFAYIVNPFNKHN